MPSLTGASAYLAQKAAAQAGVPDIFDPNQESASLLARGLAVRPQDKQLQNFLARFGSSIDPATLQRYGLTLPKPPEKSLLESVKNTALGGVTNVLSLLSRPQQAIFQAIRPPEGEGVLGGALAGLRGEEPISFQQVVLGRERGGAEDIRGPGWLRGLIEFAGSTATDPLSYVSFGSSAVAKQGLTRVGKELGEETAKSLAKKGLRASIKTGITNESSIRQALAKNILKEVPDISEKALTRKVGKELTALRRQSAGGFRFAGKTLPGTRGLERLGGGERAFQTVAREVSPGRKVLQNIFVPRAATANQFGKLVADQVGQALSVGRGLTGRETDNVARSIVRGLGKAQVPDVDKAFKSRLQQVAAQEGVDSAVSDAVSTLAKIDYGTLQEAKSIGLKLGSLNDALKVADLNKTTVPQLIFERAQEVAKARGFAETMKELNTLTDNVGKKLIYSPAEYKRLVGTTKDVKKIKELGLEKITTAGGQEHYIPKVIKKDIEQTLEVITKDEGIRELSKFVNQANTLWRAYATVFPAGFGFFSRNELGNIMNMFYAGVRNPGVLKEAAKLQRAIRSGKTLTAKQQDLWEKIIQQNIVDTGTLMRETSSELVELSKTLSGQPRGPLGRAARKLPGGEKAAETSAARRLGKIARHISPVNPENVALRAGRAVNTALENNSRIALFIDGLNKGMSPSQAAIRTKKFLFDYADLTAVERRQIKPWVAFYTYMRRNIPLQVEAAIQAPWKVTAQIHGLQGIQEALGAAQAPTIVPGRLIEQGGFASSSTVFKVDLPLLSALDQISAVESLGSLAPGGKKADLSEILTKGLAQTAGVRPALVKGAASVALKRDLFTGQDLDTIDKRHNMLLNIIFPGVGKFDRAQEGILDAFTGESRSRLLNLTLGIQVQDINEATQRSESFRRLGIIEDYIKNMGEVPSLTELRDMGLIPPLQQRKPAEPASFRVPSISQLLRQ